MATMKTLLEVSNDGMDHHAESIAAHGKYKTHKLAADMWQGRDAKKHTLHKSLADHYLGASIAHRDLSLHYMGDRD